MININRLLRVAYCTTMRTITTNKAYHFCILHTHTHNETNSNISKCKIQFLL